MNLKPNLWTLLFVIAAGAFLYLLSAKKEPAVTTVENNVKNEQSNVTLRDTISKEEAVHRYEAYADRMIVNIATCGLNSKARVDNADVVFFHLPKDEVREMLSLFGGKDVYGILNIENPNDSIGIVDLMFSDKKPRSEGAVYFDFSTPCPTLCDGLQ